MKRPTGLHALAPMAVAFALSAPGSFAANGAATVAANPSPPVYGQAVSAVLEGGIVFFPFTRYSRSGDTFVVEYEQSSSAFGPFPPGFGSSGVSLGELVPGTYSLKARIFDADRPDAEPQEASTQFTVPAPGEWGVYVLPSRPRAFEPVHVVVKSAAYLDPASIRATVEEGVVRVDFEYASDAAMWMPAPDGFRTHGSVAVGRLPPGAYRVEAWGRPRSGGASERYFQKALTVATHGPVVEFYADGLDHFFVSAGPDEIARIDSGAQPGWKRTGLEFNGWLREGDAPAGAKPVCRFYASGPNSHFYTADAAECEGLRALEARQRASFGSRFDGWAYEGIAFWALVPQNGQCPAGSDPVERFYNARASQNDSNHRFTGDVAVADAMAMLWASEGIAFCSPR